MPALAPYLVSLLRAGDFYLAVAVAAFSVGENIGQLLFGAWFEAAVHRTAGPRMIVLSCQVIGLVGSALYVLAAAYNSPHMVLWGRLLQGVWMGGQHVSIKPCRIEVELCFLADCTGAVPITV